MAKPTKPHPKPKTKPQPQAAAPSAKKPQGKKR